MCYWADPLWQWLSRLIHSSTAQMLVTRELFFSNPRKLAPLQLKRALRVIHFSYRLTISPKTIRSAFELKKWRVKSSKLGIKRPESIRAHTESGYRTRIFLASLWVGRSVTSLLSQLELFPCLMLPSTKLTEKNTNMYWYQQAMGYGTRWILRRCETMSKLIARLTTWTSCAAP